LYIAILKTQVNEEIKSIPNPIEPVINENNSDISIITSTPEKPVEKNNKRKIVIASLALMFVIIALTFVFIILRPERTEPAIINEPEVDQRITNDETDAEDDVIKNGLIEIVSDEFGITFQIPQIFYHNGGKSTGAEGDFVTPYIIGENSYIKKSNSYVSCDLMAGFLKDPESCSDQMQYESIWVYYQYSDTQDIPLVRLVDVPSWVSFEDSAGCGSVCKFRYDNPVLILGNNYNVKVAYESIPLGDFTWGLLLEEEVPAGINSRWRSFDISPFLGFADGPHSSTGIGLSNTSRTVIKSLKYN
jgi:hypothetical protein